MVLYDLFVLVVSVLVLAKSAELVVDSAYKLSKFFGLNQWSIGFLLVAFSTSLPELMISIVSSTANEGGITAGNVFGSNTANILLVLGILALVQPIRMKKHEIKEIATILLVTSLVTIFIILTQGLSQIEGFALILIFFLYVSYLVKAARIPVGDHITKREALSAFLIFAAAMALTMVSSSFVVNSAVRVADALFLAKSFIGATIIAVGTSLPELSIDLQALRKKRYALAVGDIMGSCMTNISFVLGVGAMINPIPLNLEIFQFIMLFALVANIVLFYYASTTRSLKRREGIIFVLLYLLYLAVLFSAQAIV